MRVLRTSEGLEERWAGLGLRWWSLLELGRERLVSVLVSQGHPLGPALLAKTTQTTHETRGQAYSVFPHVSRFR